MGRRKRDTRQTATDAKHGVPKEAPRRLVVSLAASSCQASAAARIQPHVTRIHSLFILRRSRPVETKPLNYPQLRPVLGLYSLKPVPTYAKDPYNIYPLPKA